MFLIHDPQINHKTNIGHPAESSIIANSHHAEEIAFWEKDAFLCQKVLQHATTWSKHLLFPICPS